MSLLPPLLLLPASDWPALVAQVEFPPSEVPAAGKDRLRRLVLILALVMLQLCFTLMLLAPTTETSSNCKQETFTELAVTA
jgi:hypothetical protein